MHNREEEEMTQLRKVGGEKKKNNANLMIFQYPSFM